MTSKFLCPKGYICNQTSTISLNMMSVCPDGFICPQGTTSIDLNKVGSQGNLQLCPDGYWCPAGSFSSIPDYGQYNSPQLCKDEVVCINEKSPRNPMTYLPGPNDQYGNFECPRGSFCKDGKEQACPWGHYCDKEGLTKPVPCPLGQYNRESNQTQCDLCPLGSFCMGGGTTRPTKCKPGYTCQVSIV